MDASGSAVSTFRSGDAELRIDFAARVVLVDGVEVHFTPTEYDVLACLASRAGTVVSTPEIIEAVWGSWYGPTDHVFVHVHHLRRKLGPCGRLIVTKRKAGYLLRRESASRAESVESASIGADYLESLQQDAQARDAIWLIVDRGRHVTWVSDSILPLLGWKPAKLLGAHPWSLSPDGDVDDIRSTFSLSDGSSLLAFQARMHHADGSVVPVRISAQILRGADGEGTAGLGELRVLRPGGAPLAEESPAGHGRPFVLHYDGDHRLTAVEPHQSFLGWDPDEVIGTAFSLSGLDLAATRSVMGVLTAMGPEHALGPSSLQQADGTTVVAGIKLRLVIDDGVLTSYTGEVHVLD